MSMRALNIRTALHGAPPLLDFVLPGLTPGSVGTIVGAGGVGKTTLLMQVATALSIDAPAAGGVFAPTGETPPCCATRCGRIHRYPDDSPPRH